MDNVLTQAAVDMMQIYTGDLKKILSEIDVYKLNLKHGLIYKPIYGKNRWKDQPEEFNKNSSAVLTGVDPEIPILREKIY